MNHRPIDCAALLARLDRFDAIIDARSPAEFAQDRLPGAINCPTLNDAERAKVGTLHRCSSAFEARRLGAAYAANNIAVHLRGPLRDRPRTWMPLVYCWRGGERSAALAHVMMRIGWQVHQLDGGYRAFRRFVTAALAQLPGRLGFRVLCGATGSGKSRMLWHLERAGAQVLDLERIAAHRGSVLGALPNHAQPSQRHFETRLWWALQSMDPARPVFVESESRRIGERQLPDALLEALRAAPCLSIELELAERIRLLREEYRHFEAAPEHLGAQLECLKSLHGASRVHQWQSLAAQGRWDELVACLISDHYDPLYQRSMRANFQRTAEGRILRVASAEHRAFETVARELAASCR